MSRMPDHVVVWRAPESPIVYEPIGHMAWSCPSSDGLRRVPMSHVAMKVSVTSCSRLRARVRSHLVERGWRSGQRVLDLCVTKRLLRGIALIRARARNQPHRDEADEQRGKDPGRIDADTPESRPLSRTDSRRYSLERYPVSLPPRAAPQRTQALPLEPHRGRSEQQ